MALADAVATVEGAFTSIPIIDLSKCGTPEGWLATANEVRDACMKVGFFYIRNHGIPPSCLDDLRAVMQSYFDLPMATKMKDCGQFQRRICPTPRLNIDPSNRRQGDFHEGFGFQWEDNQTIAYDKVRGNDDAMANIWPSDDLPEFRGACLAYYHAAVNIEKKLYALFSLALGQGETFFDKKTRHSTASMRLIYCPTQDGHPEIDDDTPGPGAHTDFECFTIFWQQPGVQALQIKNSEGRWIDAPPIEDTLLVNIGDELAMWTNDVFKSTVQRAINKSGKERYSIPVFFGIDGQVNVEPLTSFVSEDRPVKYGLVTAGEYVQKRFDDMFSTV